MMAIKTKGGHVQHSNASGSPTQITNKNKDAAAMIRSAIPALMAICELL
jgi:hypothetical protein